MRGGGGVEFYANNAGFVPGLQHLICLLVI